MIRGNRDEQRTSGRSVDVPVLPLESETLHAAAVASGHGHPPLQPPRGEDRIPIFWRIFGSTVLSIAALIAVTLYQQVTGSIHEMSNELNHLSQDYGDLVKKDDFNSRIMAVSHNIKEVQAANGGAADLWRERAALLERQLKAAEEDHKRLARESAHELQRLGERLAVLEGRQAALPATPPAQRLR